MITNKTKYALKALCELAQAPTGSPLQLAEIAERNTIPKKFLEVILGELRHHGLLRSRKGPGGGYLLAKPPEQITLADVLRITDGPMAPVPCLSRTGYERCAECADEVSCSVRLAFKDAYGSYVDALERTTLADILARQLDARETRPTVLRYSI